MRAGQSDDYVIISAPPNRCTSQNGGRRALELAAITGDERNNRRPLQWLIWMACSNRLSRSLVKQAPLPLLPLRLGWEAKVEKWSPVYGVTKRTKLA